MTMRMLVRSAAFSTAAAKPPEMKAQPRMLVRSAAFSTAAAKPLEMKAQPSSAPLMHRYGRKVRGFVGRAARVPATILGIAALGALALDYKVRKDVAEDAKKRVLVLPFHRIRLVETKKPSFGVSLESLSRWAGDMEDDHVMEMEVRELVDVIHAAAQDPNIVALYGIFGHGFRFSSGGMAHIEEVRTALKVFRESHRFHLEPNLSHEKTLTRNGHLTPKPTYAFADSFANPMDPGNKEYYLASVFSHVHLQQQGEVNLFGLGMTDFFLRNALEKYGIKAHVFKHGKYKNAPNMFTERRYTREHKNNVANIIESVNQHVCDSISQMRGLLRNFEHDALMWELVQNYGTFSAHDAHTMGLIDYTPLVDPLDELIESTENSKTKEKMKLKWGKDTDMDKFNARESISLKDYSSLLAKRKNVRERSWKTHAWMSHLAEKSLATRGLMRMLGYEAPNFNIDEKDFSKEKAASMKDKIALVRIQGPIDDSVARKTAKILRKIKKDKNTKCVVLRVDSPGGSVTASETILQECRNLPQPIVCSMGNTAASGGYYVATDCDRIFALPNTITGSIGVFGIKLDLTGMAAQYGVTAQHIATGRHTATYNPFHALTRPMKDNLSRNVDRYYEHFKSLVSQGRGLSSEAVEEVAQGRVWTGEQAKIIGLVDELGGLNRAIAYAQRNYTGGDAVVEVWPKKKSKWERFRKGSGTSRIQAEEEFVTLPFSQGLMLTMDENLALKYVLRECLGANTPKAVKPLLPPDFWV